MHNTADGLRTAALLGLLSAVLIVGGGTRLARLEQLAREHGQYRR
jgi:hypothetical protein